MSSELYQKIRSHPRYEELVRRRSRLAWSLAGISLGLFFGFILVAAFRPSLLAIPISSTGVTTIAVVLGAAMVVLFWLLTGVYIRRTTQVYDKMSAEILRDVKE